MVWHLNGSLAFVSSYDHFLPPKKLVCLLKTVIILLNYLKECTPASADMYLECEYKQHFMLQRIMRKIFCNGLNVSSMTVFMEFHSNCLRLITPCETFKLLVF